MNIDLTPKLKARMVSRPRTRGRYSSSEVYAILVGFKGKKMTPQEWLTPQAREVKDMLNMWNGTMTHDAVQKLMGTEFAEHKREYKYKGIVLVAKADYLPPDRDEVWEFKTSEIAMDRMKPWQEHQVKLYTTMFERPVGLIYQPVQHEKGLFLKHVGTTDRDDAWFEDQLEQLYLFHQEVEKIWGI